MAGSGNGTWLNYAFIQKKGGKRADDSRVNYGTACTCTRGVGARLSHSHGDDHAGKSIRPDDSGNSCRDAGHFLFHGCLRSEEHTSELQSLMRISYAVFCLKKKKFNSFILMKRNPRTQP